MPWTQEDLAAINAAIAIGATRVKYQDPAGGLHDKEYASLDDLLRRKRMIEVELGITSSTPAVTVIRHDRGI